MTNRPLHRLRSPFAALSLLALAPQVDAQILEFTIPGFASSRYTSLGADLPDRQFILGSPSNQAVYIHEQSVNNSYALSAGLPQDFGHAVDLLDPSELPQPSAIRQNTLAVVGCPGYQQGLPPRAGRVVVFALRNRQIVQSWSITPPQPRAFGEFGYSVSITERNQQPVLIVGEPGGGANDAGRAHLFVYDSQVQTWVGEQTLSPSAPAQPGDLFGWSVDSFGDRAVVGAPLGAGGGYAELFERSGSGWSFDRRFTSGQSSSDCGFAVAISEDHTAVASPAWDRGHGRFDVLAHQGGSAPVMTAVGDERGQLGYSIAIRKFGPETHVLVGKPEARSSGALELHGFVPNGAPTCLADWQIPTLPVDARFGSGVLLGNHRAIGLSPQVDSAALGPGAVFDYALPSAFESSVSWLAGTPGVLGVAPQLTTRGQLERWHRLAIEVSQANPNSPALLAVGSFLPSPVSIFGGQIGVSFDITLPFLVDPFGQARFDIPALPRNLSNAIIPFQAFVMDVGAPEGVAFSDTMFLQSPVGY